MAKRREADAINRSEVVIFRCTRREKNHMRMLARIYARGSLSTWLRHCALNADREFLKPRKTKKGATPAKE